ncbi:hypothetical protein Tco_0976466 [Tanacetum coccineum]|uniref:Uncharacterized protein n=1 Tax=Tanacetum coccineum TaxID=301880 RepID=A0ABQ5EHH1_9ASTR
MSKTNRLKLMRVILQGVMLLEHGLFITREMLLQTNQRLFDATTTELAQDQEPGVDLNEEQIAFLEDKGENVNSNPAAQALTTNVIFQTYGIDAFDFKVNEAPTKSAAFMANLSDYGLDVLFDVPNYNIYHDNMVFE